MRDGLTTLSGHPSGSQQSIAYRDSRKGLFSGHLWKVWLVAGDCCLIGFQPVLVHLSKNAKNQYSYHPISVNVLVEVTRTVFATAVLISYGSGKPGPPVYRSLRSFSREARLNKSLLVPAALYSLNNYLKFMMQLYFNPTTAKMMANLKVLVIAVLMKLILRRSFSVLQWEALLLLCIGITINQLDHCLEGPLKLPPAAVLYTGASLVVPSLASIFNEWALKRHMDTSVHLQNFYLYVFGLGFNTAGLLLVAALTGRSLPSLFSGHSKFTLLLVVNNALQGVLSSFFYKFADTILKKYSSTIATIWTALLSALLFDHPLTFNFALAVTTVFCSMHIFFAQGGLTKRAADGGSLTGKLKEDTPSDPGGRTRGSTDSLTGLEADFADPDNMHLVTPRRPTLLPR